jgi:hypothetical protein
MAVSGAPTTNTDANGRLVVANDGRSIACKVLSVTNGLASILLVDPYATLISQRITVNNVPCYALKEGLVTE